MRRFRTLRIAIVILRVLGWAALALGLVVAIAAVIAGLLSGQFPLLAAIMRSTVRWPALPLEVIGLLWSIATIVSAVLYFVAFYALSEFIELALAIEQNTREAGRYLRGEDVGAED